MSKEIKGIKTIKYPCPNCEYGDKFDIIEVVREPFHKPNGNPLAAGQPGLYRCQCTVCGFEQTISSKSPRTWDGKSPKKKDEDIDY